MTPSTRLMLAMSGLVLLTGSTLALLTYRQVETSTFTIGLSAVVGILVLAILLAHYLARPLDQTTSAVEAYIGDGSTSALTSSPGEASIIARAFNRMTTEMRDQRDSSSAASEKSAQRERILIAAVEAAGYPVITKALDGTITAWNPAAEQLYKYTAAEAIGANIEIIIPPDERAHYPAFIDKVLKEGRIEDFETVRVAKDGRKIDVSINIWTMKSPAGEVVGLATITRDITAQKFAEEKFRLAVESCPCGMVMADGNGQIVMVNTEIERQFGFTRDELLGQRMNVLLPEQLSLHAKHRGDFLIQPETSCIGTGRALFALRKDGTEFPIEVGLNPIHTREGPFVLSVIVDVTERKRLERLKDEFVATVSHELRTPLTSIAGSLGLLSAKVGGTLPHPETRLLAIAQTNSLRLVRLINDILDIEKIEAGKVIFNLARVEIRSLVEQAIEANRGFAETYGVRTRLDATATCDVRADPDRLIQVVTNLLSNAIKFSPPDNEVVVAIERQGDFARLSVRDHGPGIPAGFKSRIFEKFVQADVTNARKMGGTGLGLSIVKQIVDRLDGRVGFADAPGGGTVFYVELPCWERFASAAIDRDARPGALRILLCEDDTESTTALREQLRKLGFATDFAYSVGDAITCATATQYHAVIVDLHLPDGDGINLIVRLRALPQYRDRPIIVVSGDPSRGRDDVRSSTLNVRDWLNKPVDFDRLMHALTISKEIA